MLSEKVSHIIIYLSAVFKGVSLPADCGLRIEWRAGGELRVDDRADFFIRASGKERPFLSFAYEPGEETVMSCLKPESRACPVHKRHIIEKAGSAPSAGNNHIFKFGSLSQHVALNPAEFIFTAGVEDFSDSGFMPVFNELVEIYEA